MQLVLFKMSAIGGSGIAKDCAKALLLAVVADKDIFS